MKYELKDGSLVEGPETLNAEQSAWLKEQGGAPVSVAKDVLKSVGQKGLEGLVRAPFIGGDLVALGARGVNMIRPDTFGPRTTAFTSDQAIDALRGTPGVISHLMGGKMEDAPSGFPSYEPQTTQGRYAGAAAEALGGAVGTAGLGGLKSMKMALTAPTNLKAAPTLGGLIGRTLAQPTVQAGVVGGAGELGGDVSRGFDSTQEQNPAGKVGGAALTALGIALGRRMNTPTSLQPLHEATRELTPGDLTRGQGEAARLKNAGATTVTVGDTLPQTSAVPAVERDVANNVEGGKLRQKLVGRAVEGGDIQNLLGEVKTMAQRTAVPGSTMLQSDQEIADAARGARTAAMRKELQGAPLLPDTEISRMAAALEARARHPRNLGTQDETAHVNAANALRGLPTYPLPQPGFAPGRMSGPNAVTGGPAAPVAPPQSVPPGLPSPRPQIPPPPGSAMVPTAPPAGGPVAPMQPPVDPSSFPRPPSQFQMPGRPDITDVMPKVPSGANVEALSKVVKGLSEVKDGTLTGSTAQVLDKGAVRGAYRDTNRLAKAASPEYRRAMEVYGANSPQVELAQVLADNKLTPRPNTLKSDLGQDNVRRTIAEQLSKLDQAAAAQAVEKFHAADVLSRNTPHPGMEGLTAKLSQSPMGLLAAPFSAAKNRFNLMARGKADTQLSNLLSDPHNPETWRILESISQTNPQLARALKEQALAGAVNGASQTGGQ